MSFAHSVVSRRAPKRVALRSFAIALTTALIVVVLPSAAFAVGEPAAPAQPTVTHGDGMVSVAFVAPADNGSAIQFYTAACTSSDGGAAGSTSNAASPLTVSSLTNGKTYTCTVSATNGNGTGAASPPSAPTVPAAAPDAPVKPTVTPGNAQISVAFVAPADHGSAITGYRATCTSSDGGTLGSLSGPSSPLVVTGLTNGKTYTCRVIATNGEGDSTQSLASTGVVPATVPTTPAQPTVVRGNASISVTFTAPSGNGGAFVTGYTASCASSDGGVSGSTSGGASPLVVATLTNGKTYTCTIHATNSVGNSAESAPSASTVPATTPAAPAAAILTRGNAQISVAFVAPANGGSTITGYTATCTSSDGGTTGSNTGTASPIIVFALTNGKSYTCAVVATNAVGDSLASSASATAVPATVPTAPAAATLTNGNTSISVAFVAPATGGSAITGYTASCTSSDGGTAGSNTGASSPSVVGTLTNGKTYTCTVHATNALGNSAESVVSASTVPATVPSAPDAPTLTMSNTQIRVAFVAPADGSSAITGYTARCTSTDGGWTGQLSGPASPILIRNLTNGKLYTCKVRATNAEGSGPGSADSMPIRPGVLPTSLTAPTITGTPIRTRTLTAHRGTWRAAPAPTFKYQWQRCGLAGMACVNIAGAVGPTYVLRAADVNRRLRVVVRAANVIGSAQRTSSPTAKVTNG